MMYIYHFIYDTYCERRRNKGENTILVSSDNYFDALTKAKQNIKCRPLYTGYIDDYNLTLSKIERNNFSKN